jgi:hypothetical protein
MAKLAPVEIQSLSAPRLTDARVIRPPRGKRTLLSGMVIFGYVFLGLIAFWPSLPQIRQRIFSRDGDFTLSLWMLGWMAHAVTHFVNPFFSNSMFVPTGVNLAQNTQGPLLGLAAAPITLTYGPTVTANLLLILAMPASAAATFIVLRKWRVWGPAAALGGLVYGFSPYMIGQALGHPVLLFLPLPPLIAYTLVSILQRRGPDRRLGLQLGVLASAQFLVSPEIFASLVLMAGIGLMFVVLQNPHRAVQMAPHVIRPIGVAFAVCAVVLAYPIWMLLAGPQHDSGPTVPLLNAYHNDLLSFVIPGPLQKVSLGTHTTSSGLLAFVDPMEAGGYVGVPVLVATGLLAWRSRRSGRMQLSLALLASSALLSLGPFLYVRGTSTQVPLPFWIVGHLPLVDNLLPVRFSFETSACVAAIISFGLDDLRHGWRTNLQSDDKERSRARTVAAFIATCIVLALVVVTQLPRWPYGSVPARNAVAFFAAPAYGPVPTQRLPSDLIRIIPGGDPVTITFPYAYGHGSTHPLLWQAEASYRFRLLGGYAFHPNSSGQGTVYPYALEPNGLQRYLNLEQSAGPHLRLNSDVVDIARITISRYHVRLIIVDRGQAGAADVIDLFRRAVGAPGTSARGFTMWIVPRVPGAGT